MKAAVIRNAIMHNLGLKIGSLAAAVIMFSWVRGAEDAQRTLFVEVLAILPPDSTGKMLVTELPDKLRLTVTGARSQLNAVREEDMRVQIDLRDTSRRYYYFSERELNIPAGVTVTQIAPASIPLRWVDRAERRLPVVPRLTGELPPGLALEQPLRVEPDSVLVRGSKDEVDRLRTAETLAINLSELGPGMHEQRVPLIRPTARTQYVGEVPIDVRLEVTVDIAEKSLRGLSVTVEGREARSVRPTSVALNLRGAPSSIDVLDTDSIVPFVTVPEGATERNLTLPVQLRGVPRGVEVAGIEPEEVQVVVAAPAAR